MRGWIFSALVAAPLALAAAPPALAQKEPETKQKWTQGQPPAPQRTQVRIAKGSPIAKVFFAQPALVLDDDGTYAGTLEKVGKELSRACGAVESYGWDFQGKERAVQQQQAAAVYEGTMQAFEKAGYKLTEKKVRAIPDPETLVFTADSAEKGLLLLWSPVQEATLLLVCDAGAPPAAKKPQPGKK